VLKEKLKGVKEEIREWHKIEYGEVDARVLVLTGDIEELDVRGETNRLTVLEVDVKKAKYMELWKLLKSKDAMWVQSTFEMA